MPRPYSVDLRRKALALIEGGETVSDVSSLLAIAQSTLRNWIALKEETKSVAPKSAYQKGHSHKITDIEAFKKFAQEHSGQTLAMMAQELGNVSDTTVYRMLKKINFTRKKRAMDTKREMKKSARYIWSS